jgi:hypothetical protein
MYMRTINLVSTGWTWSHCIHMYIHIHNKVSVLFYSFCTCRFKSPCYQPWPTTRNCWTCYFQRPICYETAGHSIVYVYATLPLHHCCWANRKHVDHRHAEVLFYHCLLVDHTSQHGRVHVTTSPTSTLVVSCLTHCQHTPQMTTMVKQSAVQAKLLVKNELDESWLNFMNSGTLDKFQVCNLPTPDCTACCWSILVVCHGTLH